MLDAGPTNPHTSLHLSGGLRVQRQVAGTNGEAPTSVGASICSAVSVGGLIRLFDLQCRLLAPELTSRDVRYLVAIGSKAETQRLYVRWRRIASNVGTANSGVPMKTTRSANHASTFLVTLLLAALANFLMTRSRLSLER